MKKMLWILPIIFLMNTNGCEELPTTVEPSYGTPAFPGAEGFGAYSKGGRGGTVYIVTNLNDEGEGSLRNAVEAIGPRIVVFEISGTIELESRLRIRNPYITIAGQTAPGDGICLKNYELDINAHNVIIRYLRVRPGDPSRAENDAISIHSSNVIVDHCSASWSIDEALSATDMSDTVTVQWCIISEALHDSYHSKGAHSCGSLIRPDINSRISFHHNLYAHNWTRNPRVGNYNRTTITFDFRNNVIYNWEDQSGYSGGPGEYIHMNYVGNYLKAGPSSEEPDEAFDGGSVDTHIYQEGNLINGLNTGWNMFSGNYTQSNTAFAIQDKFQVETKEASSAYNKVLNQAGASFPSRDAVDERIIQNVLNETGGIIDSQDEVGGWPNLTSVHAPIDNDRDGMPDVWEIANGLNPFNSNDFRDFNLSTDGYTNIEVYINSLTE